jgi:ABC-type sugar transport system permease subunit
MRRMQKKLILPFLTPALLIYLVFVVYPACRALWVSMLEWSGFNTPAKFVGLQNFQRLVHDDSYLLALRNTVLYVFVGGVAVFALAFLFSVTITRLSDRTRKILRAVIFLPTVIAPIALTTLWGFVYNPRFGLLNSTLRAIGLGQLARTWTDRSSIFSAVMVALIWLNVGMYLVLLLAGIDKIPLDFYDAARIDGANSFQMFRHVTIPLLWDVLVVGVILWGISALKVFEFPYAFCGIQAPRDLWTLAIYLVIVGFGKREPIFQLGYAAAIGVTMLLLVIVFVLVARRVLYREAVEY